MSLFPEREIKLPIQERVEEFPEIPVEVENKTVVVPTPTHFKGQVHDDSGKPLISSPATQTITITLPADPTALTAASKGNSDDSMTWFSVFWLRIVKKALHFGWKLALGGEK